MRRRQLQAGEIIGGRYRVEALLGQGGMGHVYLAEDVKLRGKRWAIKECHCSTFQMESFMEEAAMLAQLQHPQLPQLVDYFHSDERGNAYLVMDYIQGLTLQQLFEDKNQELSLAAVVDYAVQLCDLLHYLHSYRPSPIIYRDLKPANIMINEHGQVRLIDFGVARHFTQGKDGDTVQMGTVGFAAPEQFLGLQTDPRSDLYSLGAMMYYLLSGGLYARVTDQPLGKLRADIPEAVSVTVQMLLEDNPNHRCQTALEVKQRLRSGLSAGTGTDSAAVKETRGEMTDKLIVIGGLFAGVGSTFAAITLARVLNDARISHALVEHPSNEPDLYMLLYGDQKAPKDYQFASEVFAAKGSSVSKHWVNGYTTWVPIHPDGFAGTWDAADSFKLLHAVKKPIVLWDVSASWQEAGVQELCHCADEIIVIVDASPGKLNRPSTKAHLEVLESYRRRGKRVHFVANRDVPAAIRKEWALSLPEPPICCLPELPYREMMQAVWKGECMQDQPLVLARLRDAFTPLFRSMLPNVPLRKQDYSGRSLLSLFKK